MITERNARVCKLFERISIAVTAVCLAAIPVMTYPFILSNENPFFSRPETWGLVLTCTALGMLLVFALFALAFLLFKRVCPKPELSDCAANRVIVAIAVFAFSVSFVGTILYLNFNWQMFI